MGVFRVLLAENHKILKILKLSVKTKQLREVKNENKLLITVHFLNGSEIRSLVMPYHLSFFARSRTCGTRPRVRHFLIILQFFTLPKPPPNPLALYASKFVLNNVSSVINNFNYLIEKERRKGSRKVDVLLYFIFIKERTFRLENSNSDSD